MPSILYSLLVVLGLANYSVAANQPFWWGVSTSSYQTEDVGAKITEPGFFKTDWDVYFDRGKLKHPKGDGVFAYSEYKRDIAILKDLGVTHYRFGIEWARVEPEKGKYNMEAIKHYHAIVDELIANGITPIICLWHWTFPSWGFNSENPDVFGWMNPVLVDRWPDYVRLIVTEFKDKVTLYAPENEPNAQSLAGFFLGIFPPGAKYSLSLFRKHVDTAADAFIVASKIIRSIDPKLKIMSVQNMIQWEKAWWDVFGYFYHLGQEFNFKHLDKIIDHIDILGFNYYYRVKASPFPNTRIIDPEGLRELTQTLADKYKKPLVIAENGWPDSKGEVKKDYMERHVKVAMEMRSKVNLIGYFYWSLVDNFEWSSGYEEKYGLYKFNASSKALEPYPVALEYKKIILNDKSNGTSK